ncbi:LysR substrate-binding domain-containing protein, partial [Lysinibacillus sp. D4A3_S15]|uniref:LysR substrate-binding domain-containing protein n=1 Tax=Lysinibacillus sp. D4A3_S15 TaxID=2941227 RepID=UPI0020BF6A4F
LFVLFTSCYILHKVALDACRAAGFLPNIISEGEDLDALKGLVAAGIGVSLLRESSLYDSAARLTVKVPIESPSIPRTVGIISPVNREIAPSKI